MQKLLVSVGVVVAAIIAAGVLLDEAGKGTFGAVIRDLAKKTTSGYGSLNA